MRPADRSASRAAGRAPCQGASSSPFTSIRSAWKVRFAGWPPVRRVAAGIGADQLGQPRGARERLAFALPHHRVGDPPGEPLVAVVRSTSASWAAG